VIEYWYQALGSKYGIVIKTDNVGNTLQRLYQARQKSNDPELNKLHLRRSPIDPEAIWIVRNDAQESD
jgi:hypothetical protein